MNEYEPTRQFAESLDRSDSLSSCRDKFHIPKRPDGSDAIYFCGNSLGLQPKNVRKYLDEYLTDWKRHGVDGHFHARLPWMPYHEFVAESLAQIVGAKPSEVVAMNSLTVNLHLMMVSFYRPTKERFKILIEGGAFPSDQYAMASQAMFHNLDPNDAVMELPTRDTIPTEDIVSTIEREGGRLALVLLGGVNYLTGQAFEMAKITEAAHRAGAVVGFDLAHAAGNISLQMHDWGVDFAVWCSYKYLNSGPGGVAGAFIHERHHTAALPRFAGWWGHNKATRFMMPGRFDPIPTAEGWQLSNPAIAPLASLRASLDLFDEAGIANLRAKSLRLTGYLEYLLDEAKIPELRIITPRDPLQRGAQLSMRVANGRPVFEALGRAGVVADWREPDVIRMAPVPLYNSFGDCLRFVEMLKDCQNGR